MSPSNIAAHDGAVLAQRPGLLIDTSSEGVQDMHEPSQVGGRGIDQDETADVSQGQGPLDAQVTRSGFLAGMGKLGIGAMTLGGLAANAPTALGGTRSSQALRASNMTIAMIENASGPFYTDNFEKPMRAYLNKQGSGWKAAFGNENNSLPTGVQLLNQYAAAHDAAVILLSAQAMSGYVRAAKQFMDQGGIFINHSTTALGGATQNVMFSHKQAGVGIGQSAVKWAKTNGITKPVVALIGDLTEAQPKKRTTWAWNTIKAAFPNAQKVGEVQGIDQPTGAKAAANLLSAHPDINILVAFDGPAGQGALTSANQAGKRDPKQFYLAVTDQSTATLDIIAKGGSVMQANWGVYFPASAVLMCRDILAAAAGKKIKPTRLLFGNSLDTPAKAASFNKIAFDPLNPKYSYVLTQFNKYLDVAVGTAQVPPGQ
jgi:ABC-type sugar transport system substrate-binding protein